MKKTYILLSMLTYGLLQPVIAFADSTEPKEIMDMFIGTLSVKDKKAIIFGQIQQYQKENPAIASLFSDKEFTLAVKSKIKRQFF